MGRFLWHGFSSRRGRIRTQVDHEPLLIFAGLKRDRNGRRGKPLLRSNQLIMLIGADLYSVGKFRDLTLLGTVYQQHLSSVRILSGLDHGQAANDLELERSN